MLKGELVNENGKEEPVCSECIDGLVFMNVGALPPVLKGELVRVSSWARQSEQLGSSS